MNTTQLVAAYQAYRAKLAAWNKEHPFDPFAPLDAPQPPKMNADEGAGQAISECGPLLALAITLQTFAERTTPLSDFDRDVALALALAANKKVNAYARYGNEIDFRSEV